MTYPNIVLIKRKAAQVAESKKNTKVKSKEVKAIIETE
tara:strand:- start:2073 stop:2186 length:114 start_codon:yes stop_codon:yes gene_type:complete